VIESIIEQSGTPYFSFKDIDENKPTGSIKIRVETIHYFLKRYAEDMTRKRAASLSIDEQLATYERQLRDQMLFDEQLANLAARQRETLPTRRMLPVLPLGSNAKGGAEAPPYM
jgi:hypothetical protein